MRLSNRLSNGITQAKLSNSMSNSSSPLRVKTFRNLLIDLKKKQGLMVVIWTTLKKLN